MYLADRLTVLFDDVAVSAVRPPRSRSLPCLFAASNVSRSCARTSTSLCCPPASCALAAAAILHGVADFAYVVRLLSLLSTLPADAHMQEDLVYECISLAGGGRVADRSTFVSHRHPYSPFYRVYKL